MADVYKRQVQGRAGLFCQRLAEVLRAKGHSVLVRAFVSCFGQSAVSYTHLDVYKRQRTIRQRKWERVKDIMRIVVKVGTSTLAYATGRLNIDVYKRQVLWQFVQR